MAKISHRERVLLGYGPDSPTSFHSDSSSEVDFRDVFGGPPRRFSIQESRNGSIDYVNGEGADGFRSSFLGFGEKPVFGNDVGARRKYQSEDFFDDIFGGDQSSPSCSQSPRIVNARDSFSSAPGSRVMSPSRPLPPSAEPVISPAKFSLPVRLTSTDFVASPLVTQGWNSPSSYPSRLNQTNQNHDVLQGDARSSYRPSPLSNQTPVDIKESPKAAKLQDKPGFVKDSKCSTVQIDTAQFHFSIYKWASKGVPLVISVKKRSPSKLKESIKIDRSLSATERVASDILVGGNRKVDITDDLSSSFTSSNGTIMYLKSADSQSFDEIAQELSKSVSDSSSLQEKNVKEDVDLYGLQGLRESDSLSEKGSFLQKESKAKSTKSAEKTKKLNPNSLGSFFQEEKKVDETMVAEKGGKERKVKDKENQSLDDFVPTSEVNKVKAESYREAKDDPQKGEGLASKVKDFVKVFNQEGSSKATRNFQSQSQSLRWKDTNYTLEVDNEVKSTAKNNEEPVSSVNWDTTVEDSEMANRDSFPSGKQQFDVSSSGRVSAAPLPALPNGPVNNGARDFTPNINATPGCDIPTKKATQQVNKPMDAKNKEKLKNHENKVRQWSKGKEGNIRALLSTLQYVLWPNSGWKPVPLVDIIEGNAVKRAYQRALLCLHPDKLQQKGAAPHQKFIAEKVFDILQEAWDHFNSLGPL